jgi:hypothetical protein
MRRGLIREGVEDLVKCRGHLSLTPEERQPKRGGCSEELGLEHARKMSVRCNVFFALKKGKKSIGRTGEESIHLRW